MIGRRDLLLHQLADAERAARASAVRIIRHKQTIADNKKAGCDTTIAAELLEMTISSHAEYQTEIDRLKRQVSRL